MINTDSYYEIGSGHIFCQDYADNGVVAIGAEKFHYAICCDGCSGSKDSDVGARMLAKMFPDVLRRTFCALDYQDDAIQAALRANFMTAVMRMMTQLDCSAQLFDATIAAAIYDEADDKLYSFAIGDGKFLYKHKDGTADLTSIDFPSNAPYYITYELSLARSALYEESFGKEYSTISHHIIDAGKVTHNENLDVKRSRFYFSVTHEASQNLASVSVFTDGVDTYHKKDDVNVVMNRAEAFQQLTVYKLTHGEFVKRRMLSMKKFCLKDNWQHFDDVSVATISFT